jgi:ATP-dependent Lhr-like helicase
MLEITPAKILVEPLLSFDAAIPAWEGELIPVPFGTAQEVGRLRAEIAERGKAALNGYPVSGEVAERMAKAVRKQGKGIPTHETLLLEYGVLEGDPYIVIHSCFGSLVNETLGRAVSSLLASRLGSVGLKTDPYRIVFKLADITQWREVADVFQGLKPEVMKEILTLSLPNTDLFRWRFSHVARRFGIISRDADAGKPYLRKLMEVYRGTPVFQETLNELFQEKLDLEKASEMLRMLERGEIKVIESAGLSYLGRLGILKRYELVGEPRPEKEVFSIFRQRLLGTKIALVCTHCANLAYMGAVGEADKFQCKRCQSRLLGLVHWKRANDAVRLLGKHLAGRPMTPEEREIADRILATSYLIVASGHDAVKVLAGRGIGPATASRILARMTRGDDLLKDVLEAEKKFAKTRRFWQDR